MEKSCLIVFTFEKFSDNFLNIFFQNFSLFKFIDKS